MAIRKDWNEVAQSLADLRAAGQHSELCLRTGIQLESFLHDLYLEARGTLGAAEKREHDLGMKEAVSGRPSDHWSLGELTRVLFDSDLVSRLEVLYGQRSRELNPAVLDRIRFLRNEAAHGNPYRHTAEDADFALMHFQLVLRSFGKLRKKNELLRAANVVSSLSEAEPLLERMVTEVAATGEDLEIKLIALTLYQAWDLLIERLLPAARGAASSPRISIECCMIDPEWKRLAEFDPRWPRRSKQLLERLGEDAEVLLQSNESVQIKLYRNFPSIHGFLVNRRLLVGSLTRREQGRLTAAFAPYFVVTRGMGSLGEYLVAHYESWWPVFAKNEPVFRFNPAA